MISVLHRANERARNHVGLEEKAKKSKQAI
jgi:hypothetical protein